MVLLGVLVPWQSHRFGTELSAAGVRKRLLFRRGKTIPWAEVAEIETVSTRGGSYPRLRLSDGTRVRLHEPSAFGAADDEFRANIAVMNDWWKQYHPSHSGHE